MIYSRSKVKEEGQIVTNFPYSEKGTKIKQNYKIKKYLKR